MIAGFVILSIILLTILILILILPSKYQIEHRSKSIYDDVTYYNQRSYGMLKDGTQYSTKVISNNKIHNATSSQNQKS